MGSEERWLAISQALNVTQTQQFFVCGNQRQSKHLSSGSQKTVGRVGVHLQFMGSNHNFMTKRGFMGVCRCVRKPIIQVSLQRDTAFPREQERFPSAPA